MGPHILEDLTHKMEGQPSKKQVNLVLGMYRKKYVYIIYIYLFVDVFSGACECPLFFLRGGGNESTPKNEQAAVASLVLGS